MMAKHWLLIAMWAGSLGTMVAGLKTWDDAFTPIFVGGMLASLATHMVTMFTDKPKDVSGGGTTLRSFVLMLALAVLVTGCSSRQMNVAVEIERVTHEALIQARDVGNTACVPLPPVGERTACQAFNAALLPALDAQLAYNAAVLDAKVPAIATLVQKIGELIQYVARQFSGVTRADLLEYLQSALTSAAKGVQ